MVPDIKPGTIGRRFRQTDGILKYKEIFILKNSFILKRLKGG